MSDLQFCPFCGDKDTKVNKFDSGTTYGCSNKLCPAYFAIALTPEAWNTRHTPEGYNLVPVEPTRKMIKDGAKEAYLTGVAATAECVRIYKAMIEGEK